ncbi:MAG: hypothetical protein L6R38_009216 [Xanthoria sp. 2 TBL-2021]|nr:MAG: hypothetical protein L6R38_009216 [Xanthoria sp. 2 TBL-2021]
MSCCSGKSNSFILWEEDDADVLEYVPCVETTVTVFYHTLLWKNFCGTRESVALAFAEQKTLAVNGVGAYGRARKLLKSSYESTIHEEVRGPLEFGARKKSHGLGSEGPSGAGMNAYAGRYGNPLIAAATQDFEAIVKLPLEHGAHVDAEGSSAFLTALSSSSYFWYHPVANMLRDQSAKPDLRRDNDDTACEGGHETTVDRPSLLSMPAIFPSLIPSDISCLVLYEGLKPYYEKWPMREGTDGGNNFWTPPNRKDPYLGDRAGASRFRWMGGRMIDITAGNLDKKYSSHGVATVFTQWRDTNHLLTVTIDAEHKNIAENEDVAGNKNIAEKEDVAEEYGSWKILVFDHIPLHVSQQTYCSSALGALLNLRRVHLTPKNSRSHFELSSARSALARLFCLVGRVLPVPLSRRFALLSPVLFAPSISAISVGEPANVQSSALSYDYWVQALRTMQTDLAAVRPSTLRTEQS